METETKTDNELAKENQQLREALSSICEENYDDDDKKRHLRAIIDQMKSTAEGALYSHLKKENGNRNS